MITPDPYTRRWNFLLILTLLTTLVVAPGASAAQTSQVPLPPTAIPQFVQPLPRLTAAGGTIQTVPGDTGELLTIRMCEFKANLLPAGAVANYAGTWVWGYLHDATGNPATTCADLIDLYDDGIDNGTSGPLDTYLGPVVLSERDTPTEIKWVNDLGTTATSNVLAYKYSTDLTLHWADPLELGGMRNMCNHMAMYPDFGSECALNYGEDPDNPGTFTAAPIPAAVHLHGGEVPPELDGGPDAWFTSDGLHVGDGYYSRDNLDPKNYAIYRSPTSQDAAPIWFHDHTLGTTRLNVYSGLAGGYLIRDDDLELPAGLAPYGLDRGSNGPDEVTVPLIIQDRRFDTNGELFFPADSAGGVLWSPNPEHPYWVPEFEGDVVLVNGKAWPRLDVEPKRYRFLFLNGSNARTYEMFLVDPITGAAGPNLWVIATDGGYLDRPVMVRKLTMMPGERYEVIVDFNGFANPNGWLLKNTAKTPFPAGVAPQGTTTGRIMKFDVGTCSSGHCGPGDTSYNPAHGMPIRTGDDKIPRLVNPATGKLAADVTVDEIRQLTLNEVMGMPQTVVDPVTGVLTPYPGGPLEVLVNNSRWSGERITGVDDDGMYTFEPIALVQDGSGNYLTELLQEGETEVWEIVNLTADAHPIHLHLVQFQLINRQMFNTTTYGTVYNAAFPGGGWDPMLQAPCAAGEYCPSYGPPLPFDGSDPRSAGKLGGNPDVGKLGRNGKPMYLQGRPMAANAQEAGWKDTIIAYPGQVTRLAVRWAPTSLEVGTLAEDAYYPFDPSGGYSPEDGFTFGYVWHCHIIDHEDNEMMRPDAVYPNDDAVRTYFKGTDY
jgi:FtsP/CotA-like multicopper oxidase with cupredoxin domain